jgi:hypothetical protein
MSLEQDITEVKKTIDRRVPVKAEFTKEEDPSGLVSAAHDSKNVKLVWWYNPSTAEFVKSNNPSHLHAYDIGTKVKKYEGWARGRVFDLGGKTYLIIYHPERRGLTNQHIADIYSKVGDEINTPITRVINGEGANIGYLLESFGIKEIEHSKLGAWQINESGIIEECIIEAKQ